MKRKVLALRRRSCGCAERDRGSGLGEGRRKGEGRRRGSAGERVEKEGREIEPHPVTIRPVEKESKHLITEQPERFRGSQIVRDAHEGDEIEYACSVFSIVSSLFFRITLSEAEELKRKDWTNRTTSSKSSTSCSSTLRTGIQ